MRLLEPPSMLPSRLRRFHTHRHERGVTLVLVAITIFAMLGVAALAVDLVTLYVSKAEAQRVADAAALAGAKVLVDGGVTANPTNTPATWDTACDLATVQSKKIASKGLVGGSAPATVSVCFGSGGSCGGCPGTGIAGTGFGVNPQVGITLQSATLPLFLARIWGQRSATVSATSVAEGFNPSGTAIPVATKCVTPWIIPNIDPLTGTTNIVDPTSGLVISPGPAGFLNQTITLQTGCAGLTDCTVFNPPFVVPGPLTYYPADLGTPAASGPSCSVSGNYQQNITACNPTPVTCGSTLPIDTTVFPDGPTPSPNTDAVGCLIRSTVPGFIGPQDTLDTTVFPYRMQAGSAHPLVVSGTLATGDVVSSSRSVVNIPIYDSTAGGPPPNPVTIIGFMQAFVESVDPVSGQPTIHPLNVSGCGTSATGTPVGTNQTSAVPVRLIH